MAWSWIILGWIQNLEKWKEKILFGKICIFSFLEVYIRSRQSGYITSRLGWHAGTTRVSVKIASILQLFTLFCIQHGLTEDKNDTDIKTEIILWIPLPRKRVDHLHFPRGPFQKHKSTQINVGWNGWKIPGNSPVPVQNSLLFWGTNFPGPNFPVPVPVPSKKEQNSRDRDVTLWFRVMTLEWNPSKDIFSIMQVII